MSDQPPAPTDRGAHAVVAAAKCVGDAVLAHVTGDASEARRQLESARDLLKTAGEEAIALDDTALAAANGRACRMAMAVAACLEPRP